MLSLVAYGEALGWSRGVYPGRSGSVWLQARVWARGAVCASSLPSACVSAAKAPSPPHCTQWEAFLNYLLNVRTDAGSSQCEVYYLLLKCDYYEGKNIHVRDKIAYNHQHTLTLPFSLCDLPFSIAPVLLNQLEKQLGYSAWLLSWLFPTSTHLTDDAGLDLENLYHVMTEGFYEGELTNFSACHWPNDISWKPWEVGNGGVWWCPAKLHCRVLVAESVLSIWMSSGFLSNCPKYHHDINMCFWVWTGNQAAWL